MDPQALVVALVVLAALGYVGKGVYRSYSLARRPKDGGACAGGCGCSTEH